MCISNLRYGSLIELYGCVWQRARLEIEFSLLLTMSGLVIKVHMGQLPQKFPMLSDGSHSIDKANLKWQSSHPCGL